MATCGSSGNITDGTGGAVMVGGSGANKENGPDVRCVEGVCPRPHADFLLVSLAFFRSVLSVSTNSLTLSMFLYFD